MPVHTVDALKTINLLVQRSTVTHSITWQGVGVHTGARSSITIRPAEAGHGLIWRSAEREEIAINSHIDNVIATTRSTDLGKNGVTIKTVEHFLSALHALHVTDATIVVDGPEVPIMDGGSLVFYQKIKPYIHSLDRKCTVWKARRDITFDDPSTGARYLIQPADSLEIDVEIDYKNICVDHCKASFHKEQDNYAEAIAPCRTFVMSHEVPSLIQSGMIRGGDIKSAVVIYTPETDDMKFCESLAVMGFSDGQRILQKIKTNQHMKYDNEPARHKILDLYGDIYLLDMHILAKISAYKPGHRSNIAFVRKLKQLISDGQTT